MSGDAETLVPLVASAISSPRLSGKMALFPWGEAAERVVADLLASDWLAAHDAAVRAEALRPILALSGGIIRCSRCGHTLGTHWPNTEQRSTTACVTCLDASATTTWVHDDGYTRTGVCDHTAETVFRYALAAALRAAQPTEGES